MVYVTTVSSQVKKEEKWLVIPTCQRANLCILERRPLWSLFAPRFVWNTDDVCHTSSSIIIHFCSLFAHILFAIYCADFFVVPARRYFVVDFIRDLFATFIFSQISPTFQTHKEEILWKTAQKNTLKSHNANSSKDFKQWLIQSRGYLFIEEENGWLKGNTLR